MSLVAIVGRPNVGKSTLFNRLVGERKAIVDAAAGTTRDRHYGKTDWNGREFSIIDTGGYTVNSDDMFEDEIRRQVLLAIDEADVILFVVEVSTGITDLDASMADMLRRTSKKVLLVCNKVDNNDQIYSSHEFYSLGLGDPYCISSMSGSGTGDMMDAILAALPADTMRISLPNCPLAPVTRIFILFGYDLALSIDDFVRILGADPPLPVWEFNTNSRHNRTATHRRPAGAGDACPSPRG